MNSYQLAQLQHSLNLVYPRLEGELKSKIAHLVDRSNTVTSRIFHFQYKYETPDLAFLFFQDRDDHEIHALGSAEKMLPLLGYSLDLYDLINSWVKQNRQPYVLAYVDSDKPFGYFHPSRYQKKLHPVGLIDVTI